MTDGVQYQVGIPESLRSDAAELYDEAFGAKFALAVRDRDKRILLLSESLQLSFALSALENGTLAGLAGFHTSRGGLTGGMTLKELLRHQGLFRGLWAAMVFSLYERSTQESELLMDGIAVKEDMRGKGIGTKLLDELKKYAAANGYSSIRLDVIDTNPGARQLYERQGFIPTRTEEFAHLRRFLGFGASTTMVYYLDRPVTAP